MKNCGFKIAGHLGTRVSSFAHLLYLFKSKILIILPLQLIKYELTSSLDLFMSSESDNRSSSSPPGREKTTTKRQT